MTLTAEQLEQRKHSIGASEIAAIVGVHPYQNAIDVWQEKVGEAPPFEGNEFSDWGNRLEQAIAEEYASRMEVEIRRPCPTIPHPDIPWATCTPDALVPNPKVMEDSRGVECKNRNYFDFDHWGEPGTDEVPLEVAAQCHWSMEVTGLSRWDVAVLIGGNRMGIYTLTYDPELAKQLLEKAEEFWFQYVQKHIPPPLDGSPSSTDYVSRKWKTHGGELIAPTPEIVQLAHELRVIRGAIKDSEARKAALENQIKDFIGENAGIELPDGAGKITWKRPKPTTVVNWQHICETELPLLVSAEAYQLMVKERTTERETARRFLVQFKK